MTKHNIVNGRAKADEPYGLQLECWCHRRSRGGIKLVLCTTYMAEYVYASINVSKYYATPYPSRNVNALNLSFSLLSSGLILIRDYTSGPAHILLGALESRSPLLKMSLNCSRTLQPLLANYTHHECWLDLPPRTCTSNTFNFP